VNAAAKLAIVPDDAAALLDLLAPGEPVTFQTFGEGNSKGSSGLSRILHGTLAQHRQTLADLNARGAGIFWMVNAGNGKGRKAPNVRRIRALFVDLDGAPLGPVQSAPLAPHAIVESSPNRWHAYWRVSDCTLADFTPMQKALIVRFDSDPIVHDLPRVLRLPGFEHRKGKPFASHIVALCDAPPYTLAAFREAFGFDKAEPLRMPRTDPQPRRQRRTLPDRIPKGERNTRLLSLAAGFVRRGFDLQAVNDRMQRINAERCTPPLGADEVDGVVLRAFAYGSEGFARLPHKLLDSRELNALPLASRWIIVTAFRRYDGSGALFALTHADCRDIPGCAKEDGFNGYRAQAVASGILQCKRKGAMTRNGRAPNLYAINPHFLPSHTPRLGGVAHTPRLGGSYIDRQGERAFARAVGLEGRKLTKRHANRTRAPR